MGDLFHGSQIGEATARSSRHDAGPSMKMPRISPRQERCGDSDGIDLKRGMVEAIRGVAAIKTFSVLSRSLRLGTLRSQQPKPGLKQVQEPERAKDWHSQSIGRPPAMFPI